MSLISDIADYLATQGLGTVGTDIFYSYMPDAGDNIMAVLDSGGVKPDIYLPTKDQTFQIFIRSSTYAAGKSKLDSVRSELHNLYNTTIGSYYFYYIQAIAEGGHLGRNPDMRGLDEFSINFHAKTR